MRRDHPLFEPEPCGASRALGATMLWLLAMFVGGAILLAIGWSPAL